MESEGRVLIRYMLHVGSMLDVMKYYKVTGPLRRPRATQLFLNTDPQTEVPGGGVPVGLDTPLQVAEPRGPRCLMCEKVKSRGIDLSIQ